MRSSVSWSSGSMPDDAFGNRAVHIGHGLVYSQAAPMAALIAQFERFVGAGGRSGRHGGAADATLVEHYGGLNSGIAA